MFGNKQQLISRLNYENTILRAQVKGFELASAKRDNCDKLENLIDVLTAPRRFDETTDHIHRAVNSFVESCFRLHGEKLRAPIK